MPSIDIDQETYEQLLVASRLLDEPISQVISRVVQRVLGEPRPTTPDPVAQAATSEPVTQAAITTLAGVKAQEPARADSGWLAVYRVYKGHRVEGAFNPKTLELRLATPPFANRSFPSPTAAAEEVVGHYSGDVRETNNTNGRRFWKVSTTGKNLRSVIGQR